jgi:outer membrane immunogenic protein
MRTMNGLRRLGAGALVVAGAALGFAATAAADGAPRGSVKDCCGYDWRGFYFGGHVGLSNVDVERSIVGPSFWSNNPAGSTFEDVANGRLTLGGHLGYNFTSGPWVFGIEATLSDLTPRQNVQSPFFPAQDRFSIDVDSLTTVTGRLGYAMNKAMVYVKGGYAGADVESTASTTVTVAGLCGLAVNGNLCRSGGKEWHNGWTIGTGIELAVHKNVIAGFEYNYIDLGSESSITPTSVAAGTILLNQSVDVQIHSFMGRISYKFN